MGEVVLSNDAVWREAHGVDARIVKGNLGEKNWRYIFGGLTSKT